MNTPTEQELQLMAAKMLPDKITVGVGIFRGEYKWTATNNSDCWDDWFNVNWLTEGDYVAWLSMQKLKGSKDDEYSELADYVEQLALVCGDGMEPLNVYEFDMLHATYHQKLLAIARVKGWAQ